MLAGNFVKNNKTCRMYFPQKLINCAAQLFDKLEYIFESLKMVDLELKSANWWILFYLFTYASSIKNVIIVMNLKYKLTGSISIFVVCLSIDGFKSDFSSN